LRSDNINSNHRKSTNYCRERSSCVTCIVFQLGQSYIRANFWQGVHNSTASMYIANRDRKQSSPLGKFSRSHAGRAGMTNGGSGGRTSCPDWGFRLWSSWAVTAATGLANLEWWVSQ
jgi:hypothetical protein